MIFMKISCFLNSSLKVIDHALPPLDLIFPALWLVIPAAKQSRPALHPTFYLFVLGADVQLGECGIIRIWVPGANRATAVRDIKPSVFPRGSCRLDLDAREFP